MTTLALKEQENISLFSAREKLRTYADRALARLRLQEALNAIAVVLTVSAWLLVVALLSEKLFALQKQGIPILIIWAGISVLGLPYILWRVFSPHLHEQLAAVMADDRLGLHARISSALTLDLKDPAAAAFSAAFFSEALQKVHAVRVEQAFPIRRPAAFTFLLAPILAASGIYVYMPQQDLFGVVAAQESRRKAEEISRKAGQALQNRLPLEDMKKKALDSSSEEGGQYKLNKLIEKADTIAKEMKEGKRNPDEALAALSDLKQEIKREKEKLVENKDFISQLEKLSAKDLNLEESDLTKEVSEALKMGDPGLAARQMRKLAQQIKNDIINNPNKTEAQKKQEMEKLKREVEKLAGALAENEVLKNHLQELSENTLSKSDFENLESEIKKQEQKQKQGKLGNEIEQSMEESAQELERLEEDNDANLNEEEEKEMEKLENVEEGVDEAMQGLNGEENAAQEGQDGKSQGKNGQKQGQGKQGKGGTRHVGSGQKKSHASLNGSASGQGKEGGKGSRQMGGNESGKNGQNGAQPGQGAGGEGKGQGSRPQGDIADPGFKAEKVKGKMQAGAITGLSHFRGQGAKGDAPAEFVQALQAAEQESSSSLELERIPADAREVVKDYFSRVKQGANIQTPDPAPKQNKPAKESLGE